MEALLGTGPLAATPLQGAAFGALALPICLWVAYTDLSAMRIRNEAVLALMAVFVAVGPFVLPLDAYAWRFVHLAAVLAIGFGLTSIGAIGAGDAKFAAAMAPFVALPDTGRLALLFAALLVATYAAHRLARMVPAVRALAPGWRSWSEPRDFPMGITLGATLAAYLALAAAG